MSSSAPATDLPSTASDVMGEVVRWLSYLAAERRMSPKTVEAYERDVRQFLQFLCDHLGERVTLAALGRLAPADMRGFMASRRAHGIGGRSLMRSLAGVRSFARFLEKAGKGRVGALAAVRTPKIAKTLPKPLAIAAARSMTDTALRAGEEREPWILARDAAVLALLYGSGLRISEALTLTAKGFPASGKGDVITVTGKGNKQRMVPVLPQVAKLVAEYRALCPYEPADDDPLFFGAKGGPLSAARRATRHGAAARRARIAGDRDAARAAPLLRHASARPRRRPARDPGTARPRLVVDDPDLYRRRYRTAA